MKIGFVGGGTGGHFYPLMAVGNELNNSSTKPQLYYLTGSLRQRIVDEVQR